MVVPPLPVFSSYTSFDTNATFDPYAGIAHPAPFIPTRPVPRPTRLSTQRFIGNRMSHLSELVDIARSETGSNTGESEPTADPERHRRKLAKMSRVYERAIVV
jgi:hypothetical protein